MSPNFILLHRHIACLVYPKSLANKKKKKFLMYGLSVKERVSSDICPTMYSAASSLVTRLQTCTVEVPSSNIRQDNQLSWTRIPLRLIRQFPGLVQGLYHGYLLPSALIIFHQASKHRGPITGLTNLWHACLKWHAEWFLQHATFLAGQILFFFLSDQLLYIVKKMCLRTPTWLCKYCIWITVTTK